VILSAGQIRNQVTGGGVVLSPFEENLLNPNSYNYRLGETLSMVTDEVTDPKREQSVETVRIPEDGFTLYPNRLYLGHTFEVIGSQTYVVSLIGRSSIGRLGLFLQITADLGQLGTAHRWTLELKVVQPLKLYPRMKIGQVSFWRPTGSRDRLYDNGYTSHDRPMTSRFHVQLSK
jgi:dCTP deaminase